MHHFDTATYKTSSRELLAHVLDCLLHDILTGACLADTFTAALPGRRQHGIVEDRETFLEFLRGMKPDLVMYGRS